MEKSERKSTKPRKKSQKAQSPLTLQNLFSTPLDENQRAAIRLGVRLDRFARNSADEADELREKVAKSTKKSIKPSKEQKPSHPRFVDAFIKGLNKGVLEDQKPDAKPTP